MIIWREGESERGREASERERKRVALFVLNDPRCSLQRFNLSISIGFYFWRICWNRVKAGSRNASPNPIIILQGDIPKTFCFFFTIITSCPSLCRAVCRHRLVNFFMTIGIWVLAKKGKGKVPKTTNTFNELNCCLKQCKSECKITGQQSYLVDTWASNPRFMQSYRITDKKTNICT